MKKAWLVLTVLLPCLLMTVGMFAVQAETPEGACPHCSQVVAAEDWKPWSFTAESEATSGHYYISGTYSGTKQTGTVTIPEGANVCLDLRGQTYYAEEIHPFEIYGVLSVMDSVGGGQFVTTGKHLASGGFAKVKSTGVLNVYSGTIRFAVREDITIYTGGLVYIEGGEMNVYGGTLAGGVTKASSASAQGGNIYMNGGSLNVTGGEITGGMVLQNDTTQAAQGGNIFAYNGAQISISGDAVVSDGYSEQDGGNFYIASAHLTLSGDAVIEGGHAYRSGGNIRQTSSSDNSITITGGKITGGVAAGVVNGYSGSSFSRGSGGGGNMYVSSSGGTLTISGGEITGDIRVDGISALTLSGEPKIGLGKSNGLMIASTAVKADVSGLTGNAEIYVWATGVFTQDLTDANAALEYFKGAVRTGVSVSGSALKGAQGTQGYCPHCGELKTWSSGWYDSNNVNGISQVTTDGTHRYLSSSSGAPGTINAAVILDMNGYAVYRENTNKVITINAGKSLTVLDSFGGGQVVGTGSFNDANNAGAVIYMGNGSNLTLLSGTLRHLAPWTSGNSGKTAYSYVGGVIYGQGSSSAATATTIDIRGGVVRDGVVNKCYSGWEGAAGGNIGLNSANSVLTISGGMILNGTAGTDSVAGAGGNIYTPAGTCTITGGFIMGGTATQGGNIFVKRAMTISGGTVAYGSATNGGNLYGTNTKTISGGVIVGGSATNGGNLYVGGSTTIEGGVIVGGLADELGGNIYQAASGTLDITNAELICGRAVNTSGTTSNGLGSGGNIYLTSSTVNVNSGALVFGGYASVYGGNVYGPTSVTVNVKGGILTRGLAQYRGGNVYIRGTSTLLLDEGGAITNGRANKSGEGYGGNIATNSANVTINLVDGTVNGGSSTRSAFGSNICLLNCGAKLNIGNVYVSGYVYASAGTVTLSDAARIVKTNGSYDGNIKFTTGKMVVADDWTGEASAFWEDVSLTYGQVLADENGASGAEGYTGKLVLEGWADQPWICGVDGKLVVGDIVLMNNDGSREWYAENAAAVAGYDSNTAYMLPKAGELPLAGGNYVVDLMGQELDITGTGTVTCYDSANDTYVDFGSATIDGPTLANTTLTVVNGRQYVVLEDNGTYTFHCLDMRVNGVSIRPSVHGVYYSCVWSCDDALKAALDSFGVAVSTNDMPGATFMTDGDTMWTTNPKESFESGVTRNSVLIQKILKDGAENDTRGKTPIFAAPYIVVGGEVLVTAKVTNHSLYSTMKLMEANINDMASQVSALESYAGKLAALGLTGADWTYDFTVPEGIVSLGQVYVGTTAYQGELHDHANTGGTSDGLKTLEEWLAGMKKLDMDFAAIVDHKQYLHMELDAWNGTYFIGGTEAMAMPTDLNSATQTKMHFNMVFSDPMDLKATVEAYDALYPGKGFNHYIDEETGEWHFEYLSGTSAPTKAQMAELIELVKANNGVFVHVHPKTSSYIVSDDPLDYWFADWTGLEVYYTINSDRNSTATKNNYKLWKDLLALGKKVWATAGNDEHAAPANKALSTIYSTKQDAEEFVELLSVGNFSAGHVGVKMVVGDTAMGSETDFTGKQIAFSVSDFHSTVYHPDHEYRVDLYAGEEVVYSEEIDCENKYFYCTDADASVKFYRVEVWDVTTGEMLALGNPIWNTAAESAE